MTVLSAITHEPLIPESEQERFPALVVHGYEILKGGELGPLSRAVAGAALSTLRMRPNLKALLVGGWHLAEAGPEITIADAMAAFLVNKGRVSPTRIITKRTFPSLNGTMPARCSWEELALLKKALKGLAIKCDEPLMAVAWDFHVPRLTAMYRTFGFPNVELLSAEPEPHEGLGKRKWMERAARIVRMIDPHGVGIICHETRLRRTLQEGLQPLIP